MEKLEKPYDLVTRALKTLHDSFAVAQQAEKENRPAFILAAQDSIIQRFEYSYDSFWKFLKRYLEIELEMNPDEIKSPKSVFRACVSLRISSVSEGEILIRMADDRNITSHCYDIQQVRQIIPDIPEYHKCMLDIIERIELKL